MLTRAVKSRAPEVRRSRPDTSCWHWRRRICQGSSRACGAAPSTSSSTSSRRRARLAPARDRERCRPRAARGRQRRSAAAGPGLGPAASRCSIRSSPQVWSKSKASLARQAVRPEPAGLAPDGRALLAPALGARPRAHRQGGRRHARGARSARRTRGSPRPPHQPGGRRLDCGPLRPDRAPGAPALLLRAGCPWL